jgi:hypothetical protein
VSEPAATVVTMHATRRIWFPLRSNVAYFETTGPRLDLGGRVKEMAILAEELFFEPGFKGMLALADRATGKLIGITLWETEDDLRQSDEVANQLRSDSANARGADILDVERFEVVVNETG